MIFSQLNSVDMVTELLDIIENSSIKDKRLLLLLNDLLLDNQSIDIMNVAALQFKGGNLSETDLLIYLNKYRSFKGSITD